MGFANDTPRCCFPPAWAEQHFAGADDHAEERQRHNTAANSWRSGFRDGWDTPGVYTVSVSTSLGLATKVTLIIPKPEDYRVIEMRAERTLV